MSQPLQSDSITKLLPALAKAQARIDHAHFDSTNPAFKSKYASIESLIDATKKILLAEDIIVVQQSVVDENGVVLVTTLYHTSGEWLRGYLPILNERGTAQSLGSGMTYARRYALAAMANVGQEDDDGTVASTSDDKAKEPAGQVAQQNKQASASRPAKAAAAQPGKMIYPSLYPESIAFDKDGKRRFIEDFATDELLVAEKTLVQWKKNKPTSFPRGGDAAIELIAKLKVKSGHRQMDEELDLALAKEF